MGFDFVLPDLGEGITEGEIRRWLVKEGDAINEHQTILEVETDKAVVEVPSPKKGFVQKIRKLEGEIAKVGYVLLTIAEKILTTPAGKNLAKRLGVDIEKVKSTGPMGKINEDDVIKASGKVTDLTK